MPIHHRLSRVMLLLLLSLPRLACGADPPSQAVRAGWIRCHWGESRQQCRASGTLQDGMAANWLELSSVQLLETATQRTEVSAVHGVAEEEKMSVEEAATVQITRERLRDQIRGGLLGQILGNLNGLPHEMKYIAEPGNVTSYIPSLPDGARTDDDTDFEWVYIVEMQRRGSVCLTPEQIRHLWRTRINRRVWCSNQYARQLMDIGLSPPLTGRAVLNPWADFNISGQFLCETFGLLAPAMPQTAARIGLNYTTAAIDLEPAQTTQMFTAMIATAFVEPDIDDILDAGLAAVDTRSELREIVTDVRRWCAEHPDDWRTARQLVQEKYSRHDGAMRDRNGYELNTAATVAALVYGQGDFVKTLITAFNFGWDADNNAATAGTIIGVIRGYRWMMAQGWQIVDRYHNTTREHMPDDETITSFADRICDLAEQVVIENGGHRGGSAGRVTFHIQPQLPRCVKRLETPAEQVVQLRQTLRDEIEKGLGEGDDEQQARAAYLAICLDMSDELARRFPTQWQQSLQALDGYQNVLQAVFYHAEVPGGAVIRRKALAAGLKRPDERKPLW